MSSTPRCLVTAIPPTGGAVAVSPEAGRHLARVLRLRAGDDVVLLDGRGGESLGRVVTVKGDAVTVETREFRQRPPPSVAITLFQALPKGDRMDLIAQKAVELGVAALQPVDTQRVVVRMDSARARERCERWRRIAAGAAEQSDTPRVPEIRDVCQVANVAEMGCKLDLFLVGSLETDSRSLRVVVDEARARKPASIGVVIGPEGDLTPEEYALLRRAGAIPVSLGPRVLRTETAALYCLSVLAYEFLADDPR